MDGADMIHLDGNFHGLFPLDIENRMSQSISRKKGNHIKIAQPRQK